jgi:hypothetical protein
VAVLVVEVFAVKILVVEVLSVEVSLFVGSHGIVQNATNTASP